MEPLTCCSESHHDTPISPEQCFKSIWCTCFCEPPPLGCKLLVGTVIISVCLVWWTLLWTLYIYCPFHLHRRAEGTALLSSHFTDKETETRHVYRGREWQRQNLRLGSLISVECPGLSCPHGELCRNGSQCLDQHLAHSRASGNMLNEKNHLIGRYTYRSQSTLTSLLSPESYRTRREASPFSTFLRQGQGRPGEIVRILGLRL